MGIKTTAGASWKMSTLYALTNLEQNWSATTGAHGEERRDKGGQAKAKHGGHERACIR